MVAVEALLSQQGVAQHGVQPTAPAAKLGIVLTIGDRIGGRRLTPRPLGPHCDH